jgi:hypothetical protein
MLEYAELAEQWTGRVPGSRSGALRMKVEHEARSATGTSSAGDFMRAQRTRTIVQSIVCIDALRG